MFISISKNVYIYKLNDIANKYNHAYQNTIKKKSIDVNSSKRFNFEVESKDKDPKFIVGDH